MKKFIVLLLFCVMFVSCAGFQTTKDQAIQYRQQFNILLGQWNTELMTMPEGQRIEWAQKSVPIVQSAVVALDTMDMVVGQGGQLTSDNVQMFLAAKNKLIDLIANLIVFKKN